MTNALKHAPGLRIDIGVDCGTEVTLDVLNRTGVQIAAPQAGANGGHGLAGIRKYVTGLGDASTSSGTDLNVAFNPLSSTASPCPPAPTS